MGFPTDKYTSGLDKVYTSILKGYANRPITLLEIGVYEGGSMLFFEDMLPQATIYGIDILDRPACLSESKVLTSVIDQNDTAGLENLATLAGGFDVIIDDGSHFTKETKNSFDTLWKHVKNGGIYVIEDWVIGVKTRYSENIAYSEATREMGNLVLDIASKHKELGITSFKMVVEETWQSYAIFKK